MELNKYVVSRDLDNLASVFPAVAVNQWSRTGHSIIDIKEIIIPLGIKISENKFDSVEGSNFPSTDFAVTVV